MFEHFLHGMGRRYSAEEAEKAREEMDGVHYTLQQVKLDYKRMEGQSEQSKELHASLEIERQRASTAQAEQRQQDEHRPQGGEADRSRTFAHHVVEGLCHAV